MKEFSETEKAWLAGVIDGEGDIGYKSWIDKNGWHENRVSVNVSNTNIYFINKCKQLMECGIYEDKRGGNRKILYRARTSDRKKALFILQQILPFLIIKKQKAEDMIKFIQSLTGRRITDKQREAAKKNARNYWIKTRKFKWSTVFEHCIQCGLVDSPHCTKGTCKRCYGRSWYANRKQT